MPGSLGGGHLLRFAGRAQLALQRLDFRGEVGRVLAQDLSRGSLYLLLDGEGCVFFLGYLPTYLPYLLSNFCKMPQIVFF